MAVPDEHYHIAGIDEVGRGCLAGSVMAAAVILRPGVRVDGLADSKSLSPKRRDQLANKIRRAAVALAIGRAEPSEIDQLNIHRASLLAMRRAFAALSVAPDEVFVDGSYWPDINCPGEAVIHGDSIVPEISAASIIAKVERDREMRVLDAFFPQYGFLSHKGYPTALHTSRLKKYGVTFAYRKSYRPVAEILHTGTD